MLIICFSITVDMNTGERLTAAIRSLVSITIEDNEAFLCVKNEHFWGSRCMKYNLLKLNGVFERMLYFGNVAFSFTEPKHKIIINVDKLSILLQFMSTFQTVIENYNIKPNLEPSFDPMLKEFIDTPVLKKTSLTTVDCLSTLILENCSLSSITEQIGDMPITYLSLTGSTLGTTESEKTNFFDFMFMSTITKTLKILEMNETNLNELPFQIFFLKNLHTLSVAGNNLTYIPYYIGELENLSSLYINKNLLTFLPECLSSKMFKSLNITNNKFNDYNRDLFKLPDLFEVDKRKEKKDFFVNLSHLCFFSLVENKTRFNTNDLPRHLIKKYINTFTRCKNCNDLILPDYTKESFDCGYPKTINIIKNTDLFWKYYECTYKCGIPYNVYCGLYLEIRR